MIRNQKKSLPKKKHVSYHPFFRPFYSNNINHSKAQYQTLSISQKKKNIGLRQNFREEKKLEFSCN